MIVQNVCHFIGRVIKISKLLEGEKRPYIVFILAIHNETILEGDMPKLVEKPTYIKCLAFGGLAKTMDFWVKPGATLALTAKVSNNAYMSGTEVIFLAHHILFIDKFYHHQVRQAEMILKEAKELEKKYKEKEKSEEDKC